MRLGRRSRSSNRLSFNDADIFVLRRLKWDIRYFLYSGEAWIVEAEPGHQTFDATLDFLKRSVSHHRK